MAAAGSKPVFTQAQVIDQLTTNWSASGYSAAWDKPVVSYSLSYLPAASGGSEAVGWQAMTAVMKNTAREVFELWDDVIAIDITESANDAGSDISFNYSSTTGGSTYARWSGSFGGTRADMAMTNSDIWFADNWWTHDDDSDFYGGGYGITTYIHEIGHALGLSHPGSYNGSASFASDAEYHQDTRQYTTMSYFNAGQNGETVDHTAANGYSTRYAATPLLHDILALQSLYGADTTTRTGNTVYGFNSNAGRSAFDFTETVDPIVAIWDAGGVDTIDVSGWSTNQTVDLTAGAFSSVGSMTKNLAIAYGAVIENAIGGGGGDTLLGNAASNRLEGRNGNDTLRGGAGNDTLLGGRGIDTLEGGAGADIFYFAAADQGGTVLDFSAADRLRFASTSLAGTVFATASQSGADTSFALNGTSITLKNTLKSGLAVSGADILMSSGSVDMVINGTSASETLSGGSGNDSINGLGGTDRLYGGDGDDILDAGAGGSSFQYLYGQSGNDSYHYAKASGHVFINIGGETEGGGTDTVIFSDLTAAELDVGTVQYSNANGTALDLRWDDGSDSGTLRLAELGQHIEHYEFADGRRFDAILTADGSGMQHPSVTGAIVTGGTSGSDMLIGGTGRDFAFGGAGDDLLDAGARDGDEWQYLFGQDDDDTYLYAKASGRVFITTAGEDAGGGTDTVVFRDLNAADITAQTVEFSNANGTTLDLRWQDGGDNGILRLADLGQHIERFEFADRGFDTILTAEGSGAAHSGIDGVTQTFGTSGADLVLGGAGRDFAYGGAGDDLLDAGGRDGDEWQYLFGQDDDDTYLYAKASGRVFITTAGEDAGGGTDTVVFRDLDATDITAQTVAFSNANGTTLDLRWDDGGDSGILRLADLGQHIEHYVFADGTTVDADYFLL